MKAHSAYTVKSRVENPYMFYSRFDSADPHNSAAEYVGLIRFQGKVNIVEASGAGGLEGISGTGSAPLAVESKNVIFML